MPIETGAAFTFAPLGRPVDGTVVVPGSKSITNRALVCAALAEGTSTLIGALDSEDTRVMIESLGRLGIRVEPHDEGKTLVVYGCGGRIPAILDGEPMRLGHAATIRYRPGAFRALAPRPIDKQAATEVGEEAGRGAAGGAAAKGVAKGAS